MSALARQIGGSHYKGFAIQPGVFCQSNQIAFWESCIIKRICRFNMPTGGGMKDLDKIEHELELLIEWAQDVTYPTAYLTSDDWHVSPATFIAQNNLSRDQGLLINKLCRWNRLDGRGTLDLIDGFPIIDRLRSRWQQELAQRKYVQALTRDQLSGANISQQRYDSSVDNLLKLAQCDNDLARIAAQVLLSAYNGKNYPINLADLAVLPTDVYTVALDVIRGRAELDIEPHMILVNRDRDFDALQQRWPELRRPGSNRV